jgi:hypothetical protein
MVELENSSRRTFLAWACLLATAAAACSGAPPAIDPRPTRVSREPAKAKPRDAGAIAADIVDGRVSALVFVDRFRKHPLAPKVIDLGGARELLDGTGIDPLKDIDRLYVTGPDVAHERAVLFAEHVLTAEEAAQRLEKAMEKSNPKGHTIDGPYPIAALTIKGRSGVAALIPPRYLVVVPDDLTGQLSRFEATGGLPDPVGTETALLVANEPSTSLAARGIPKVPETITSLSATITLLGDGGADIDVLGPSGQPVDDARYLTSAIDRATSVRLGIVTIRVFDPVRFVAQEDSVKAHVHLSQGELDRLLGLAETMIPK